MTDALPKTFSPGRFEFIIEWRGNRGGFRLQRLEFKADHFVDAVKKALAIAKTLERAGAYPPNSVRVVAVSYFDALAQYESEHRVGRMKNRTEMLEQVKKILQTEPARQAKFAKTGKPVRRVQTEGLPQMTTTRTRAG